MPRPAAARQAPARVAADHPRGRIRPAAPSAVAGRHAAEQRRWRTGSRQRSGWDESASSSVFLLEIQRVDARALFLELNAQLQEQHVKEYEGGDAEPKRQSHVDRQLGNDG